MGTVRARGEEIRRYILRNAQANPRNISKLAASKFGVSRQAINAHLRRLVNEGALRQGGRTRNRAYELAPVLEWNRLYRIAEQPAEDVVWRNDVAEMLRLLPGNVRDIWNYGFTEIFNNALDHSQGKTIYTAIIRTAVSAEMLVRDDGVGIFRKLKDELGLLDERHAIFELAKGKLTTDPSRHTGEGLFFASRMFDAFDILSGGVFFSHEFGKEEDWVLERPASHQGTAVFMRLDNHTSRTTRKVFDRFTSGDEPAFSKTVVPVQLAQYGNDKLISRSQAKRVMVRVEAFTDVILDFRNVPTIGQAFADEAFRVFAREHPEVSVTPIRANSEVRRMISRAKAPRAADVRSPDRFGDMAAAEE